MMGKPNKDGETYFVDQYNAEFSRDIEPMKGGFKDNYYYQMIANIRKFMGPGPLISNKAFHTIQIDGKFNDWKSVSSTYYDHQEDIIERSHSGWGRIGEYKNTSGRNDMNEAKLTEDSINFYFYLKVYGNFDTGSWPDKLALLIKGNGSGKPSWEGYKMPYKGKKAPWFCKYRKEDGNGGIKNRSLQTCLEMRLNRQFQNHNWISKGNISNSSGSTIPMPKGIS